MVYLRYKNEAKKQNNIICNIKVNYLELVNDLFFLGGGVEIIKICQFSRSPDKLMSRNQKLWNSMVMEAEEIKTYGAPGRKEKKCKISRNIFILRFEWLL